MAKSDLPQCWADAEAVLKAKPRRVLLYGIPGTGKTFAARHLGIEKGQKVYNTYIQPETPAMDVLGHDTLMDGQSVWRDGPALRHWREGAVYVVNEIDKASEDCLDALLAICDDPESAGITLPTGEYVEPQKGARVVATMNGELDDLPEALMDRFSIAVEIDQPHPLAIAALPEDMRKLASEVTHKRVEEDRRMSIRQFRAHQELRGLGVPEAVCARAAYRHRAGDVLVALESARLERAKATMPSPDDLPDGFEA